MLTCEAKKAALARVGKALADPTRCRLLVALLDGPGYPGKLAADLGLSRSNVSNHLSCLRGCGLVVATFEGRQTRYELADPHLSAALGELVQVVLAVQQSQPCLNDAPLSEVAGER
ncbi:metalloregulator ArsR/SmtB family transcription factor [Saccharopolyspora sp. NFXS83]|uniref:Cd(II)/Pb(II)-sensing metalloregulatory transcriptional regulator CmtR n=1 Tax=Saccharopolyspora sp. NFXS83 TaxID=2993560 RepID=UPI00224A4EC7|nr:metalloregulator ArsR/SmtB family transcription factor [Saccharopolyspora sp. NFXS83]MCX2733786.1 metalloregulator ArsR/SmtB family transcription factor [Saccharopolyspora sp. NFXS83]